MADLSGWAHCVNWHLPSQVQIFSSKCVNACCPYICIQRILQRIHTAYTCSVFCTHVCVCKVCACVWKWLGECLWTSGGVVHLMVLCIRLCVWYTFRGPEIFRTSELCMCVLTRKVSDVRFSLTMVHGLISDSCKAKQKPRVNCPTRWSLSLLFGFPRWPLPRWQRNTAQQCISRNHTSALACASETSFLGYLGWRNPQLIGDMMPCLRRNPTKCKENEGRYDGEKCVEEKCCEYEDAAGLALDGVAHHWARGGIMCLMLLAPKDWIYNST